MAEMTSEKEKPARWQPVLVRRMGLPQFEEHAVLSAASGKDPCREKDWNAVRSLFESAERQSF